MYECRSRIHGYYPIYSPKDSLLVEKIVQEQTTNEFIQSLTLFNCKTWSLTFTAAASGIKKVVKNETVHNFLAHQEIRWKFHLSRAPWWGRQFERLIGLTNNTMYKSIGSSMLTWNEFEELFLHIVLTLSNRLLIYVEDDVQLSV